MEKAKLKRLIDIAAGRVPADMVIKNCRVIDVYNASIIDGNIALCEDLIAGIGEYEGVAEIDAMGQYAAPGFIDSHIHVESSYVSPEELGRLIVPHGTTTIIADAHEIANVCGVGGLNYMTAASGGTALDIKWMLPSCVPATPLDRSGAVIDAQLIGKILSSDQFLGLGEFMDYQGVIGANDALLDKLIAAKKQGKLIDGHSPGITDYAMNAYAAAGIRTEHECSTVSEMLDRLSRGMYVLLREGSACHDLRTLLKGVTPQNSRHCLLCTDDCQPRTIISLGHLDNHLRICVEEGIDPLTAIQMASLNAAECYGLRDRGAVAPGLRADIVLFNNLKDFKVQRVLIEGRETAFNGNYSLPVTHYDSSLTKGRFNVKDFSGEKLRLIINSSKAHIIRIRPGGVVTSKETAPVKRDEYGEFVYEPGKDIVKMAVVERHRNSGNVAVALLAGYGISQGAIAISIAHDSHNIIVVGVNEEDMTFAVQQLIQQGGGIILVKERQILESMPMPIAGLMSDQTGEWVDKKLAHIHEISHNLLGISKEVEPVMTLCFMSLSVIPELKLTELGLYDVTASKLIAIEADAGTDAVSPGG